MFNNVACFGTVVDTHKQWRCKEGGFGEVE